MSKSFPTWDMRMDSGSALTEAAFDNERVSIGNLG